MLGIDGLHFENPTNAILQKNVRTEMIFPITKLVHLNCIRQMLVTTWSPFVKE
jgi:hypothetical protein